MRSNLRREIQSTIAPWVWRLWARLHAKARPRPTLPTKERWDVCNLDPRSSPRGNCRRQPGALRVRLPFCQRWKGRHVSPATLFLFSLRWLAIGIGRGIRGGRRGAIAGSARSRLLRRLLYVDLYSLIERVRRIQDDPIVRAQTLKHLQRGAVIATDG